MGNLFGFLHKKRNKPDHPAGHYWSDGNGYWAQRIVTVGVDPRLNTKVVVAGFLKWQSVLREFGVELSFTDQPDSANIGVYWSKDKPVNPSTGKAQWGVSTNMHGRTLPSGPLPRCYERWTVYLWGGLNASDLLKSSAHEAGHSAGGNTRHSEGGLMDPDIEGSDVTETDKETVRMNYRLLRDKDGVEIL